MKTKKLVSLVLSAVTALSFSACTGGGGTGSGPSTTNPDTWHSLDSGNTVVITLAGRDVDTEKANYQQFVNDFNETHDNIVVELQWWSDGTAYNTALDGMGKNLPDVFMLNDMMFTSYAASGKLANIRQYVDESKLNDMYEVATNEYYFDHDTKTTGKTANAALYGLPKDNGPSAVGINEDLLKSSVEEYNKTASEEDKIDIAKVTSTTEPMKFDYFLEIGEKLKTVLKSNQYVCSGYDLESIVYSNNANYFTDDTATTAAIDSDNFVGAMQFVQDMYKKGILPAQGTLSSGETQFTSGNSIFFFTSVGPWKTKDYWKSCKFTWNILPVFCGNAEGSVSTAVLGSMCYAISNNCKYKDAALQLVEYLSTDPSAQRTQYKRGQCIPNLVSLATEYSDDTQGFIAQQSGQENPCPANRSVWIDMVDGSGTAKTVDGVSYTDKITGKYRASSYTLDQLWQSNLTNYMSGVVGDYGSFWKAKSDGSWVNIKEALSAYKPTMQAALDEMTQRKNRM